jgi:hypothetical protein
VKIAPMRRRWLLVVLVIVGGLWAPRDAAATHKVVRCRAEGPYLGTGPQLPLGCPLVAYSLYVDFLLQAGHLAEPFDPYDPRITVLRNGVYQDVTGTVAMELVTLPVTHTSLDCQNNFLGTEQLLERYWIHSLSPKGVRVGERIGLGSGWLNGIEIVKKGPCAAPVAPMPACTDMRIDCAPPPLEPPPAPVPEPDPEPVDGGEPGGCAARGGGGLLIGLSLLGLIRRGPRRRRR